VVPADVDEAAIKKSATAPADAAALAGSLACAKALAVSASLPAALVIGADQVLACEGHVFDKPGHVAGARAQLMRLRGRTHQLYSGVALARDATVLWQHIGLATLVMRPFSDAFLEHYLAAAGEAIFGTVGAYQIEGIGIQLFTAVSGDASTIIGLPLLPLLAQLRALGSIGT
jgi:septum formation protein